MKLITATLTAFLFVLSTSLFSQKTNKSGKKIQNIELMDQYSDYFNSADYLGKKAIVAFFYTEDNAEICTRQILAFNENIEEFNKLDAIVVGINPESLLSHRDFVIKLQIKYPILFDRNNEVQKQFKVPNVRGTKNPQRYTFIIDKKGIIKRIIINNSNTKIHIIQALQTLEVLNIK